MMSLLSSVTVVVVAEKGATFGVATRDGLQSNTKCNTVNMKIHVHILESIPGTPFRTGDLVGEAMLLDL